MSHASLAGAIPQVRLPQEAPLLRVEELRVSLGAGDTEVRVLDDVSFQVSSGETLCLVGESGSGKSMTALAIMGLLPPLGRVLRGRIWFAGQELLQFSERERKRLRGAQMAMIFQDPTRSLNPTMHVGEQIAEVVRTHLGLSRRAARERSIELLAAVRVSSPAERFNQYPHELSGGMRQRVMIAMALSCGPRLLIADEPTTALDATVRAEILDLLAELQARTGTAIIHITHDMGVAAWHSSQVAVMYAGRIVERARTSDLFARARMPYTRALLESLPRSGDAPHAILRAIRGSPPDLRWLPTGCAFEPRCPTPRSRCAEERPRLTEGKPGHHWACWYPLSVEPLPEVGSGG